MKKIINRKFGVEIECFGISDYDLKTLFKKNNLNTNKNYKNPYKHWEIKDDSSIRCSRNCGYCKVCNGDKAIEIASPILSGKSGFLKLKKVCEILKENDIKVNKTCGLHVHVDCSKNTKEDTARVFDRYFEFENEIDKLVKPNRRKNKNEFCFSPKFSNDMMADDIIEIVFDQQNSYNSDSLNKEFKYRIESLYNLICLKHKPKNKFEKKLNEAIAYSYNNINRHCKLNVSAYDEYGTIEFRQHHGTIDYDEISNWVKFCIQFTEQSLKMPRKYDNIWRNVDTSVKNFYTKKKGL